MQSLLRDREESILQDRVWERKPVYYFMDPLFMEAAKKRSFRAPSKAAHTFYCDYGSAAVGPTINNVDFIFFPTCVNRNHWVLFVFAVRVWGVVIIDPLYDDPQYPREEQIMV